MAAMMVLTSCGSATPVFADELEYPPLQSVIDQLDADEIVRPSDYIDIYLDDAVNAEGSWFSTDHADTYRTTYHIEPVSGHPVYQISRSIRVKEIEKPAPADTESVQTGSNESSEEGSPSEDQSGEDPSDEDSQTDENGPGDTEVPPTDSGSDSGTESVIAETQEASDGQEQPEDQDNPDNDDSSVADERVVPSDTDSSLSLDEEPVQETESGIGSTLTEDVPPVKEYDDKPSILSVIVGGIAGLFAKDEIEVPEDELIDETAVTALKERSTEYIPTRTARKK